MTIQQTIHPSSLLQLAIDDARDLIEFGEWTPEIARNRIALLMVRVDSYTTTSEFRYWYHAFLDAYYRVK